MKEINANLSSDKSPLPAQIEIQEMIIVIGEEMPLAQIFF